VLWPPGLKDIPLVCPCISISTYSYSSLTHIPFATPNLQKCFVKDCGRVPERHPFDDRFGEGEYMWFVDSCYDGIQWSTLPWSKIVHLDLSDVLSDVNRRSSILKRDFVFKKCTSLQALVLPMNIPHLCKVHGTEFKTSHLRGRLLTLERLVLKNVHCYSFEYMDEWTRLFTETSCLITTLMVAGGLRGEFGRFHTKSKWQTFLKTVHASNRHLSTLIIPKLYQILSPDELLRKKTLRGLTIYDDSGDQSLHPLVKTDVSIQKIHMHDHYWASLSIWCASLRASPVLGTSILGILPFILRLAQLDTLVPRLPELPTYRPLPTFLVLIYHDTRLFQNS